MTWTLKITFLCFSVLLSLRHGSSNASKSHTDAIKSFSWSSLVYSGITVIAAQKKKDHKEVGNDVFRGEWHTVNTGLCTEWWKPQSVNYNIQSIVPS